MTLPELHLMAEAADKERRAELLMMTKILSLSFGVVMTDKNAEGFKKLQDQLQGEP